MQSNFVPFKERGDLWLDIEPLEQYKGGPAPIAPIQYSEQYVEVLGYFRAIYDKKEISERALELTQEVIGQSQGNYTAWTYRRELLHKLGKDLGQEIELLNSIGLDLEKNYQIWHHRRCIFEMWARSFSDKPVEDEPEEAKGLGEFQHLTISDCKTKKDIFIKELQFLDQMYASDAKNYHCWSHKIWFIERYSLWNEDQHLQFVDNMLDNDVRNNSVWSFRYFIIMRRAEKCEGQLPFGKELVEREAKYVMEKRLKDDWKNEAAWSYLRGMLAVTKQEAEQSLETNAKKVFIGDLTSLHKTLQKWSDDSKADTFDISMQEEGDGEDPDEAASIANMRYQGCKNNRFLDATLADIAIATGNIDNAYEIYEELQRTDPIRHKLYEWKINKIDDIKT